MVPFLSYHRTAFLIFPVFYSEICWIVLLDHSLSWVKYFLFLMVDISNWLSVLCFFWLTVSLLSVLAFLAQALNFGIGAAHLSEHRGNDCCVRN